MDFFFYALTWILGDPVASIPDKQFKPESNKKEKFPGSNPGYEKVNIK